MTMDPRDDDRLYQDADPEFDTPPNWLCASLVMVTVIALIAGGLWYVGKSARDTVTVELPAVCVPADRKCGVA